MAENIKVDPSPIQRNELDVAMELTQLYWNNSTNADIEKIDSTFARFYAVAKTLRVKNYHDLQSLVPKELIELIGR